MKLITLAALLNLSSIEVAYSYRVNLEKGKKAVRGQLTIDKINKEIEDMRQHGDTTFNKKPSYSNKNVLASLNHEPYFKKMINSFLGFGSEGESETGHIDFNRLDRMVGSGD